MRTIGDHQVTVEDLQEGEVVWLSHWVSGYIPEYFQARVVKAHINYVAFECLREDCPCHGSFIRELDEVVLKVREE